MTSEQRRHVTHVCMCVCVRCSTHHSSSSRSEGRRQRHRHVRLPRDRQSVARRLLPSVGRPAYRDPSPPRPLLGHLDSTRSRATYQPSQCAPRQRSRRVCGRERPRRPGHCRGHPASLRRGTWYVYLSATSFMYVKKIFPW